MANKKDPIDEQIWQYLEEAPPFWLRAIISVAKEILEEKEALE